MDFIKYLINPEMSPAIEADDITGDTQNEVRSLLGRSVNEPSNTGTGNTGRTNADGTSPDGENAPDDISKVDDIFGIQENRERSTQTDGPSGDPNRDSADGQQPPLSNPAEDSGADEDAEQDPNLQDPNLEENPTDTSDAASTEDLVFADKNRVRDNMIHLYTLISGDIEIIVNALNDIDDTNTIRVFNSVLNHLRNAKVYLYKTITAGIAELEYDDMLQRYITLKRVYDICVMMIEHHFDIVSKDKKPKKH